jgi:hypothetical protein
MANGKLTIGCVLIMGGALANCGGTVERGDDGAGDHGGASGSGGLVGVPPNGGGFVGSVGTCCPGVGGYAGTTGIGGFVGVPPIAGAPGAGAGPIVGGAPGVDGRDGGGDGGRAGEAGVGGEAWTSDGGGGSPG